MAEVRYDCRDVVVEGEWGGGQSLKVATLQKLAVEFS